MNYDLISIKKDFFDLIENFEKTKEDKNVSYFYALNKRLWTDQPFFYFSNKNYDMENTFINNFDKRSINNLDFNFRTIIWEKEENDIYLNTENYNILYENDSFLIMEKKSNQK